MACGGGASCKATCVHGDPCARASPAAAARPASMDAARPVASPRLARASAAPPVSSATRHRQVHRATACSGTCGTGQACNLGCAAANPCANVTCSGGEVLQQRHLRQEPLRGRRLRRGERLLQRRLRRHLQLRRQRMRGRQWGTASARPIPADCSPAVRRTAAARRAPERTVATAELLHAELPEGRQRGRQVRQLRRNCPCPAGSASYMGSTPNCPSDGSRGGDRTGAARAAGARAARCSTAAAAARRPARRTAARPASRTGAAGSAPARWAR